MGFVWRCSIGFWLGVLEVCWSVIFLGFVINLVLLIVVLVKVDRSYKNFENWKFWVN